MTKKIRKMETYLDKGFERIATEETQIFTTPFFDYVTAKKGQDIVEAAIRATQKHTYNRQYVNVFMHLGDCHTSSEAPSFGHVLNVPVTLDKRHVK